MAGAVPTCRQRSSRASLVVSPQTAFKQSKNICALSAAAYSSHSLPDEYRYEASADSAPPNRNMRLMLEPMSIPGQVSFDGNTFNITKLDTR
jgi:hypothetical protein